MGRRPCQQTSHGDRIVTDMTTTDNASKAGLAEALLDGLPSKDFDPSTLDTIAHIVVVCGPFITTLSAPWICRATGYPVSEIFRHAVDLGVLKLEYIDDRCAIFEAGDNIHPHARQCPDFIFEYFATMAESTSQIFSTNPQELTALIKSCDGNRSVRTYREGWRPPPRRTEPCEDKDEKGTGHPPWRSAP